MQKPDDAQPQSVTETTNDKTKTQEESEQEQSEESGSNASESEEAEIAEAASKPIVNKKKRDLYLTGQEKVPSKAGRPRLSSSEKEKRRLAKQAAAPKKRTPSNDLYWTKVRDENGHIIGKRSKDGEFVPLKKRGRPPANAKNLQKKQVIGEKLEELLTKEVTKKEEA